MEAMRKTISMAHVEALDARGLDPDLAVKMGLWTQPAKSAGGDDALVFPFFREGRIVNQKYRTRIAPGDKGRLWQDAGGVQCFWNEDILRDDTILHLPVVITEGEPDAITAIQCGFIRAVSVPAGAPDQSVPVEHEGAKYDFLTQARDLLRIERAPEIILAVDNDEKGAFLLHDLSVRLGRFRCKFVTYPRDPQNRNRRLKDLNEVLMAYGEKGVIETLKRAQWMKVEGIFRMSELPPVPPVQTYDIDFEHLRDNYRVRLGDFCVVTGIPSHGKTSFVNDLCCRIVRRHNLGVAFASFEQSPQRDHRRNLRTWFNAKPVMAQSEFELADADKWIDANFSFIYPSEDDDVTLDWVLDRCEATVVQHGSKVIVIDPWNEMDHLRAHGESLTEYVGRAIKAFKRFAKKFNIHLIVVAHPAKMQKDKDGQYSIPTLYDISDSANWYNKADVGIVVHNMGTHSLIRVAKSRYHDDIGKPGEVNATFFPDRRRFSIWTEGDTDGAQN